MTADTDTSRSPYSTTTIPSDWEVIPCVQYGFPEGKGPLRSPKLTPIFHPVPEDAITASPVYLLTRSEYERQEGFETGYEVHGVTSIATELQNECENDDRVLYPVHIESDSYLDEGPQTLIGWFREFVKEWLDVPFSDCSIFFSGNRSIHVHVPRMVHGEESREQLKEQAELFCEKSSADLDIGLYYAKRLFRLPGVTHEKSTLPKVEIEPDWGHDRIISEATGRNGQTPASYAGVLRNVFALRGRVTVESTQPPVDNPHSIFQWIDTDRMVLEFPSDESDIETPFIERVDQYPENPANVPRWCMYNAKEFSPYAYANGNPRSIAVVEVKGGPFARAERCNGAPMIPVYFIGAISCDGEFTKEIEHGPLQLSRGEGKDYQKWVEHGFQSGDHAVIIGGGSRSSVILPVDKAEALYTGYQLMHEDGGRKDALAYLSNQGYNVGAARSDGATTTGRSSSVESQSIFPARTTPQTRAEELQRKAEKEGIETLSHNERGIVACRHLHQGWSATWDWFKKQYGSDFKPDLTWTNLKGLVGSYDEYDHIEVPDKPV